DGVLMSQSDDGGRFKIQRDPFSSATCVATVSDGATSARTTLSGCTPTATPTPSGPSAPVPLAPANGASLAEPLTISWSAVTDPANLAQFHPAEFFTYTWTAVPGAASYRVEEDATNATFNAPEVTTANINGTSLNTGFGFVGTIYARVRAVAADGTLGLPS